MSRNENGKKLKRNLGELFLKTGTKISILFQKHEVNNISDAPIKSQIQQVKQTQTEIQS